MRRAVLVSTGVRAVACAPEPKHRRSGDLIVRAADVGDIPIGA